ncbi:MAG: 16S rRNA (uracil(1498)-N(3))-methyltransferase [Deltaproteobacteria bacterium]|nr:16S rRNA (uracil(1498)-N(3))-methyltransferase [Deltaproteobacteria bacterium]
MPQLIISSADINDQLVELKDSNYHHLKSLRFKINESVVLIDEHGNQYNGRIEKIKNNKAILRITDKITLTKNESGIILVQSIIKREKMLIALQKTTEIGVDEIIPLISQYTVVKIKNTNHMKRWQSAINDAVEQSMRNSIPMLHEPLTLKQLFKLFPDTTKLMFHNNVAYTPVDSCVDVIKSSRHLMLIIGPEGGFSEEEIKLALINHVNILHLGKNILRSETASIVAAGLISFIKGLHSI